MADCVPCHFDFEEEHVLPHLPPSVRAWLLADHARLKAAGYPAAQVLEHAEKEMVYFRRYVPSHLVAQVEADHAKFHPQLLAEIRRRESRRGAPTTRPGRSATRWARRGNRRTPSAGRKVYEFVKQVLF